MNSVLLWVSFLLASGLASPNPAFLLLFRLLDAEKWNQITRVNNLFRLTGGLLSAPVPRRKARPRWCANHAIAWVTDKWHVVSGPETFSRSVAIFRDAWVQTVHQCWKRSNQIWTATLDTNQTYSSTRNDQQCGKCMLLPFSFWNGIRRVKICIKAYTIGVSKLIRGT